MVSGKVLRQNRVPNNMQLEMKWERKQSRSSHSYLIKTEMRSSHWRNNSINVVANVAFAVDTTYLTIWFLKDSPIPSFFTDTVKKTAGQHGQSHSRSGCSRRPSTAVPHSVLRSERLPQQE